MAGSGITYADVAHAINAIQAEGHNPTIERIRQQLGTGSHTTITKHLNLWRELQNALADDESSNCDSADIVKMATEQAWQNMRRAADEKINKIKDETNEKLAVAEDRLSHALEAEAKSNAAFEELTETLHALQAEHELQRIDLRQLQHTNDILNEKCQGLEARLQENKIQSAVQLEHLTTSHAAELEQAKAALKEISVAHVGHLSDLQTIHEEDRHNLMLKLDSAHTDKKLVEKDLSLAKEVIATQNIRLGELEANLMNLQKEREESLALLKAQQIAWQDLSEKSLVSNAKLEQLENWPAAEARFAEMEQHILNRLHQFEIQINEQNLSIQTLAAVRKKRKLEDVAEQN